jgi:hypothetical protein
MRAKYKNYAVGAGAGMLIMSFVPSLYVAITSAINPSAIIAVKGQ